jgi:hypothetical protein
MRYRVTCKYSANWSRILISPLHTVSIYLYNTQHTPASGVGWLLAWGPDFPIGPSCQVNKCAARITLYVCVVMYVRWVFDALNVLPCTSSSFIVIFRTNTSYMCQNGISNRGALVPKIVRKVGLDNILAVDINIFYELRLNWTRDP